MDDRTDRLSDIDRVLGEALAVVESPDFAARVRERIARDAASPSLRRGWWMPIRVAAAAVVILAGGVAIWWSRPDPAPLSAPPNRVALTPLRPADLPAVPRAIASAVPSRPAPHLIAATTARHAEPEVLVPRAEIEMYRRLIAAARSATGAVIVDAPKDIAANQVIEQITFDPIKIDPLVPRVSAEGDRQ